MPLVSSGAEPADPLPAPEVTVVGTIGYDTIDISGTRSRELLGGSGTHVATAASHFASTALVGRVGADFRSRDLAKLSEAGLLLEDLHQAEGGTFRWHGRYEHVDADAETVHRHLGAMASWVPRLSVSARTAATLILASADPRLQWGALEQSQARFICLDSREAWIANRRKEVRALAARADLVCLNEAEIGALTSCSRPDRGAGWLLRHGAQVVAVKRGARGASIYAQDASFDVPACPAMPVDPTGAGDAFLGGLVGRLAAMSAKQPLAGQLSDALADAAALASFAIEAFGTTGWVDINSQDYRHRRDTAVVNLAR